MKNTDQKQPEQQTPSNAWGCKINTQQLRMDKAAKRYAKRVKRGVKTVRYW